MAVYTQLSAEDLAELISHYDVGELVSAKGIAEGVSNSNWLLETTGKDGGGARYILTMYEFRIELTDLPFFLGLLDLLAEKGCPVPATIHDRSGATHRMIPDPADPDGPQKAVALIEFLPGVSIDRPEPAQAHAVGAALAGIHLAAQDYSERSNAMGLAAWQELIDECGQEGLATIDPALPDIVYDALSGFAGDWPGGLPQGVCHADLFPDNVLMLGEKVSGLIDFYFACTDFFAYDLAVTHAAWCFADHGRKFRPEISQALLAGYESVRKLTPAEHAALPVLARGAAMRFVATRAYDWLNTPADALVTKKDPMDFVRRMQFYEAEGKAIFAS
ncbi:homoserine kinase [Alteraurantiacibacter aquimixticola]|uniref:Homoserine kinase n=1 Tax=Alteraurantiacibacter aquimixticola TaxID=2489173 RepID=A0A4T3F8J3_9SPHN|nr:homoserine kinase [Alteraurantiacibacter aquimixticola]TIX51330.1 homoserine kinase [Alteraurantiacibacter aquimixticola]